jgi:hypothetical protein
MTLPSLTGPLTGMHDGLLTSVAVSEGEAVLGLTHVDGRQFNLTLTGVEALSMNDFREGNIILELQVATGSDFEGVGLSPGDVRATLEVLFTRPHSEAAQKYHDDYDASLERQVERLEKGEMRLVILDPAYGAELVAYCASVELLDVAPPA